MRSKHTSHCHDFSCAALVMAVAAAATAAAGGAAAGGGVRGPTSPAFSASTLAFGVATPTSSRFRAVGDPPCDSNAPKQRAQVGLSEPRAWKQAWYDTVSMFLVLGFLCHMRRIPRCTYQIHTALSKCTSVLYCCTIERALSIVCQQRASSIAYSTRSQPTLVISWFRAYRVTAAYQ